MINRTNIKQKLTNNIRFFEFFGLEVCKRFKLETMDIFVPADNPCNSSVSKESNFEFMIQEWVPPSILTNSKVANTIT